VSFLKAGRVGQGGVDPDRAFDIALPALLDVFSLTLATSSKRSSPPIPIALWRQYCALWGQYCALRRQSIGVRRQYCALWGQHCGAGRQSIGVRRQSIGVWRPFTPLRYSPLPPALPASSCPPCLQSFLSSAIPVLSHRACPGAIFVSSLAMGEGRACHRPGRSPGAPRSSPSYSRHGLSL
jgi:hypothetical protein